MPAGTRPAARARLADRLRSRCCPLPGRLALGYPPSATPVRLSPAPSSVPGGTAGKGQGGFPGLVALVRGPSSLTRAALIPPGDAPGDASGRAAGDPWPGCTPGGCAWAVPQQRVRGVPSLKIMVNPLDAGSSSTRILLADMESRVSTTTFTIQDVRDPDGATSGTTDAFVDRQTLELLRRHDPWKFWNSHTARDVLRHPEAICDGIRLAEGNEPRGWCYCGCPREIRSADGGERVPMPPGFLFLAFVTSDMHLFDWGIERCHSVKPYLPQDYETRFLGAPRWINQN